MQKALWCMRRGAGVAVACANCRNRPLMGAWHCMREDVKTHLRMGNHSIDELSDFPRSLSPSPVTNRASNYELSRDFRAKVTCLGQAISEICGSVVPQNIHSPPTARHVAPICQNIACISGYSIAADISPPGPSKLTMCRGHHRGHHFLAAKVRC